MAVSKAVKTIRSASIHSGHLFDMSDFGMLEIVIGKCPCAGNSYGYELPNKSLIL